MSGFVHHASVYGSDEEFLAMAVPFLSAGLKRGEPVLATTTSANLALIADALGESADRIDYAETAYFGRRPPLRVTAFHRWWRHRGRPGTRVRILTEPLWAGRSESDATAWRRMESGLNVALADLDIWMICPYDTRATSPDLVAEARRTHPGSVTGERIEPCREYVDPPAYARACDAEPLPAPPGDAAHLEFGDDLGRLRGFSLHRLTHHGLDPEQAALLTVAVAEVAAYLLAGGGRPTVRIWSDPGGLVCELRDPAGAGIEEFAGYRPPGPAREATDGLWLARQLSDAVEVRTGGAGCTVRLRLPGPRAADLLL